ncbi:SulP family inorganic anion transporter [Phycisphaerales bacterium AB-hyl4]|uniref:SulP family inorganic anion transporter n=1 Tax=Natronomicrosphaera hydrolytica TaxID=3242702 RepID=A0ABV4U3X3_9BACT
MTNLRNSLITPILRPIHRLSHTVRHYSLATARADGLAGLTVAVVAIPQSMAYAIIAGVPPVYGIYTLIFYALIGSLLSSQPLLALGPINTQSLLVASIVMRLVDPGNEALYVQMVLALALIKGVLQFAMAGARLGNMVRYVSQSVIVGFTAGAGILIAAGQIGGFLGFRVDRGEVTWPGLLGIAQGLSNHLHEINPWAVALGLLALAVVIGSRAISVLMPGPLLAIVITAAIVWTMGWTEADMTLIGAIPAGLPAPSMPSFSLSDVETLFAGALALALLGLIEVYAIGKATAARRGGERISANQELFAQGVVNTAGSFLSCIPGSASFGRTALAEYAGARTAFAGIYNGLFVLVIFLLFAPAARYVPMTAIAAVLFVIAWSLIDWAYIRRLLHSQRADAMVCLGTLVATLIVPLAYAVFIGIFLNIALYLRRASQLHIAEMVRTPGGPFVERPVRDRAGQKKVMFLQVEGDLFFGLADELQDRLTSVANSGARVVILRLKRTHSLDATVLSVLERFVQQMQRKGGHVLLCGLRPELYDRLKAFGLVKLIGEDNVFPAEYGVFTSAKRAMHRAKILVGASLDVDRELTEVEETEEWAYEI